MLGGTFTQNIFALKNARREEWNGVKRVLRLEMHFTIFRTPCHA